ncbi:MAG: tetratricopeptide repeat protein [Candidatus Omnitrophica bacterium]|nr:tetratricopeptide repeat protein [Candidatus Omnitrophota bacterium]
MNISTSPKMRSRIRKELKFAPVAFHSTAIRIVDRLTNAYQKAFVSPEKIQVDVYKEQGFSDFQNGDYIKARDSFFRYLDETNDLDPSVLYMLAMCYKNMDEDKEAIEFLKKAESHAKNDPDIINALGECLYNIEEYTEAITFLEKARRISPAKAGIYYRLGICHEKINESQEAEQFYKKAIALDPGRIEYHETLGFLYQAEDRHKDAISCLRDALHSQWRQKRGAGV